MTNFKSIISIILALFVLPTIFAASTYNADGDFSVYVNSQKTTVYNDNINSDFRFTVKNLKSYSQTFEITTEKKKGFDAEVDFKFFSLKANEEKIVTVSYSANTDFDYRSDVVSPDVIKISQRSDYVGFFEFPVLIKGKNENISLKYDMSIERPIVPDMLFESKLATGQLSPILPLRYTITAQNLKETTDAFVRIEINNEILAEFTDTFTPENNYKIYEKQIPKDFAPGTYETKITMRVASSDGKSAFEWYESKNLEIIPYTDVSVIENRDQGLFKDKYTITVVNNGNVQDEFVKSVDIGFFETMLFGTNVEDYYRTETGIRYRLPLKQGEKVEIEYSFNYVALYLLLVVILALAMYFYIRKTSNPLDIETKIYEVRRVEHEGVKSLKVRIGFENIKEHEIEDLRVVFRMPSYLQVKEESFLLVEPKHVLKGKDQFKLIWDFKNFDQNDSRIVGFQLVNKKGVLGDIKIPDVEFEVKVHGKQTKYYASFPTIRG